MVAFIISITVLNEEEDKDLYKMRGELIYASFPIVGT